jgi:hypothetical protein
MHCKSGSNQGERDKGSKKEVSKLSVEGRSYGGLVRRLT